MIYSAAHAIENGWIQGNITDSMIQPNGIDWTMDCVHRINTTTPFMVSNNSKSMSALTKLQPVPHTQHNVVFDEPISSKLDANEKYWMLYANTQYDITSNLYANIPVGVCAKLILRSTFVRNGVILQHGLFDSGFSGNIGAVLTIGNVQGIIAEGTRVAQIVFYGSEHSDVVYAGGYNTTNGVHWSTK